MAGSTYKANRLTKPRFFFRWVKRYMSRLKKAHHQIISDVNQEALFDQFENMVYKTPAIKTDRDAIVETITVTSHSHLTMFLLAIKGLHYYSHLSYYITVIDDGTLTSSDKQLLYRHLKGVNLISHTQFKNKVRDKFGINHIFYRLSSSPYMKKKLSASLFTCKSKLLFIDSDLLVTSRPTEIIDWINSSTPYVIFNQDFQYSYCFSPMECESLFNRKPYPQVNSGLIGMPASLLSVKVLDQVATYYESYCQQRAPHWQVYFGLIFSNNPTLPIKPLPTKRYIVSNSLKAYNHPSAVTKHYVHPVRDHYFQEAIIQLKRIYD
jgi:hypothetical protein